jgi:hypothetical protein
MRIPRYWAKEERQETGPDGKQFALSCWRWSDESTEKAKLSAGDCIAKITRKVRQGEPLDRYSYGQRALREEIIEEIRNGRNELIAMITRNVYGALVLNTAGVMFIDIDFDPQGCLPSLLRPLLRLAGANTAGHVEVATDRVRQWAAEHPDWGLRVYRTFGGLRVLVTHDLFDPAKDATMRVLQSLESDPLYVRLCRNQESFRARLSPKPWRFNMETPPSRYPWDDSNQEHEYRQWLERYEQASDGFAVCRPIIGFGHGRLHSDVKEILGIHDKHTVRADHLPLA